MGEADHLTDEGVGFAGLPAEVPATPLCKVGVYVIVY